MESSEPEGGDRPQDSSKLRPVSGLFGSLQTWDVEGQSGVMFVGKKILKRRGTFIKQTKVTHTANLVHPPGNLMNTQQCYDAATATLCIPASTV